MMTMITCLDGDDDDDYVCRCLHVYMAMMTMITCGDGDRDRPR